MKKRERKPCQVPGCVRIHQARGFCASHYEQAMRGVTPVEEFTPFLHQKDDCVIRGCDWVIYSKSLCRTHYGVTHSFSISAEQLQGLYDDPCEICGCESSVIHVDHDHSCCEGNFSCGKCIRGGLCRSCNMALGGFKDDPELLERAAEYVRRGRIVGDPV